MYVFCAYHVIYEVMSLHDHCNLKNRYLRTKTHPLGNALVSFITNDITSPRVTQL